MGPVLGPHACTDRTQDTGSRNPGCPLQRAGGRGRGSEVVAEGSPYRYPLWLARALNSAIYDVKCDYKSDRAIARIDDFYIKIAVFIINLCCCAPFCKYT